jgi:outer membrane protein TolC
MLRCLLILLLVHSAALSQERLTLDDAIAKALEYNFDIRISKITAEQAAINNTAGNAGMLPNINGNAGVNTGLSHSHIEFADGRVQEANNAQSVSYNAAVTLNWTLFDGGRMFIQKRRLSELETIGDVQLRLQIQTTISQVIQAYAQVVWQKQQGIAIDTALALAQLRMFLSQVKFETGASAKTDYLQARVDYNARQADSLNQVSALTTAYAGLNVLMGEDAYTTYILDDSVIVNTTLEPTDKDRLKDLNLSIDLARRSAQVSKYDARIAKTYHLPVVGLNGSYAYSHNQSGTGTFLFSETYGPSGGLTLNLPIYQGGNIRRQAKVASLQAMRDDLLYGKQTTEIGRQYRNAWSSYEMSVADYKLEQQNIRYAKENMDIQKARFRLGVGITLEVREAENSYVQALIRYYTAVYNLKVNETKVLELENELVK